MEEFLEEHLTPVLANGVHPLSNGLEPCKDDVGHLHALSVRRNVSSERQVYDLCALWILPDFEKNPFSGLTPTLTLTTVGHTYAIVITKTGNLAVLFHSAIQILSSAGDVIRTFGHDLCADFLSVDAQGRIWTRHKTSPENMLIAFTEQGRLVQTKKLKDDLSRVIFHPDGRMIVSACDSKNTITFYSMDNDEPVGYMSTADRRYLQSACWADNIQVHPTTGEIYTLHYKYEVCVFSPEGKYICEYISTERIYAMAFLGDHLLLCTHDCVQVMDYTGEIIRNWPHPFTNGDISGFPISAMLLPNKNALCTFYNHRTDEFFTTFYTL